MADKKNENKNADKEKLEALYSAISQIEKHHGKGSIMKMGEGAIEDRIEVIPTGSLTLDLALGVGGVPKGRIIEIYGPESSGKTTLALSIVGECQKTGGRAAFIDAEHAFDPSYAKDIGVNVDELFISQPDSGEQALDIAETLIRSGGIDILIIDSVAALTPKAEIEGEMGDSHMGLQARLMSQALRKLTGITSKTKTTVIFINQIREKIGVLFGNPETTTGGRSLKFYASIRMDIRRTQSLTDKGEAYGNRTKVKVVKNKVAPPFKEAEFDLIFGKGISKEGGILDAAINLKIVEAQGAWIKYNGQNISQGRENARDLLKSKPELANEIEGKVREAMSNKQHAKENTEDKEK